MHPDTQWEIDKNYGWTDRAEWDAFQQQQQDAMEAAGCVNSPNVGTASSPSLLAGS